MDLGIAMRISIPVRTRLNDSSSFGGHVIRCRDGKVHYFEYSVMACLGDDPPFNDFSLLATLSFHLLSIPTLKGVCHNATAQGKDREGYK